MIPSSSHSALILLILAFLGLGLWPVTFRIRNSATRFEFYSLDFSFAALVLALIAAYTLGAGGTQLSFSDRMLVAGYTKQAWEIAGGGFFAVGNMLLLASASLIGLSAAFLLSFGVALVIGVILNFHAFHFGLASAGVLVAVLSLLFVHKAVLALAPPAVRNPEHDPRFRKKSPRETMWRGIVIAILAGIPLGSVYGVIASAMQGDFGVGPYAGPLLFSFGMLVTTLLLNVFFLNIAITGSTSSYSRYWRGKDNQHLPSFLGGIIWGTGALASFVSIYVTSEVGLNPGLTLALAVGSALLVALLGLSVRREFRSGSPKARSALVIGLISFAAAIVLLAFAIG